jgi:pyruvyltransferase
VADRVTRFADIRSTSVFSPLVRRAAGFPPQPIPMFWFSKVSNLGDALSSVIVAQVSHGTPVLVSARCRGKLHAVGSTLSRLAPGDSVWGAGAIRDEPFVPPPGVTFHAVRGPLTRCLVKADVPEVYGDPAMLLPRFYRPSVEKRFEVGMVPHHKDLNAARIADPAITTIDVRSDWRVVVDRMLECRVILSSSLHGLIVAEAYGLPAIWVKLTDNVIGDGFKFRDYFASTEREPSQALDWDRARHAADRDQLSPPRLDLEPLVRAWPEDLSFPPAVSP